MTNRSVVLQEALKKAEDAIEFCHALAEQYWSQGKIRRGFTRCVGDAISTQIALHHTDVAGQANFKSERRNRLTERTFLGYQAPGTAFCTRYPNIKEMHAAMTQWNDEEAPGGGEEGRGGQ